LGGDLRRRRRSIVDVDLELRGFFKTAEADLRQLRIGHRLGHEILPCQGQGMASLTIGVLQPHLETGRGAKPPDRRRSERDGLPFIDLEEVGVQPLRNGRRRAVGAGALVPVLERYEPLRDVLRGPGRLVAPDDHEGVVDIRCFCLADIGHDAFGELARLFYRRACGHDDRHEEIGLILFGKETRLHAHVEPSGRRADGKEHAEPGQGRRTNPSSRDW
jgi:hypothetical protein